MLRWCGGEAGGISILVKKKSLLCCVVEHIRPGGTGRGSKNAQVKFHFKQGLPPLCGLMQRPPFPSTFQSKLISRG